MKHYRGSIIFTIVAMLLALIWTHHNHPGSELSAIFIVSILGILEVSLSFDNAVVNALKLEKMTPVWQHRFLTWGIWIAVFGMRFLFPILVVSIFSHLNIAKVLDMALNDPNSYSNYLAISHPSIITFGGSFLIMLFFNYFFNPEKEVHWIGFIEKRLKFLGRLKVLDVALTLGIIFLCNRFVVLQSANDAIFAGLYGILTYIIIDGVSKFLEKKEQNVCKANAIHHTCLVNFLYLELIDASFSLDGVLGAFALSNDILIITIGLSIGAMFVRSMTLMLVEHKTLKQFPYLEHGAHWAIGTLAIIMFISSFHEVSEIVTGLTGLIFIVASLISSIIENKKTSC